MTKYKYGRSPLKVTAPAGGLKGGQLLLIGAIFGVVHGDVAEGSTGALYTDGVFDLPKATGAGKSFDQGALIYYDEANDRVDVTHNAGANKLVAVAAEPAGEADTIVYGKLLERAITAEVEG